MTNHNIPNIASRLTKAQRKAILKTGRINPTNATSIAMRMNLFRAGMLKYESGALGLRTSLTPLGEQTRAYLIAQENENG